MAPSPLPPPDHLFPCATTTSVTVSAAGVRRKTPSELRQEQLNRVVRSRNSQDGTISALPSPGSTTDQQKKTYLRLVDKYATTKSHERSKFTSSKQKDDFNKAFPNGNIEASRPLRRSTEELCSVVTSQDVLPRNAGSSAAAKNQSGNFRDVTQLSSKTKVQASGLALDMTEALKIMAPAAGRSFSGMTMGPGFASQFPDSSSYIKISLLDKFKRPPIDLSLKLSARFLSVDSLHWCHRISSANEVEGVKLFVERFEWDDKVDLGSQPDVLGEIGRLGRFEARFCQALHSWVHPPPQYLELYEIALAGARGDTICTQQSVVMFERANNVDGSANGSHVYWSRSTRGLRKKLQEQGVEFLMPFCTSDADMSPPEDLHELTEFEKLNPGHTRLMDSRTAIEKNSQSLLFFDTGNVHRLFDFLLNYRFLVGSGNATDFPVLYSPVEFSKSSLYTPEVECRRVQCPIENICKEVSMHNGSIMHSNKKVSAMLYSLELKGPPGAYITPWVIQAVCRVLQQSQKLGFEVSFVTGPLSENLNVAQDSLSAAQEVEGEESKASLLSRTYPTDVSMSKMKVIKHLRYSGGSYQANMGGSS